MNTWICKGLAFISLLSVSACETATRETTSSAEGMRVAILDDGLLIVPAPDNFCVDPSTTTQQFAIMARCDTLGASTGTTDAPLAIIAVTASRVVNDSDINPTILLEDGERMVSRVSRGGVDLAKVSAPAPDPSLNTNHWRSLKRVGDHALSVSVFTPRDAQTSDQASMRLLSQVMRTARASQ